MRVSSRSLSGAAIDLAAMLWQSHTLTRGSRYVLGQTMGNIVNIDKYDFFLFLCLLSVWLFLPFSVNKFAVPSSFWKDFAVRYTVTWMFTGWSSAIKYQNPSKLVKWSKCCLAGLKVLEQPQWQMRQRLKEQKSISFKHRVGVRV